MNIFGKACGAKSEIYRGFYLVSCNYYIKIKNLEISVFEVDSIKFTSFI